MTDFKHTNVYNKITRELEFSDTKIMVSKSGWNEREFISEVIADSLTATP